MKDSIRRNLERLLDRYVEVGRLLSDPEVLAKLDRRLHESLATAPLPLPLLLTVLRRQRHVPGGDAFARLVVEMAQSYREALPPTPQTGTARDAADPGELPQPAESGRLDQAYRARQQRVDAVLRPRIDHYLFNYARHFWMKDWYTHSPSLTLHTQGFLLRVALLRFVLLGHPQALAAAQQGREAGQATLDALAVRTFVGQALGCEHSGGFRRNAGPVMCAGQVDAADHGQRPLLGRRLGKAGQPTQPGAFTWVRPKAKVAAGVLHRHEQPTLRLVGCRDCRRRRKGRAVNLHGILTAASHQSGKADDSARSLRHVRADDGICPCGAQLFRQRAGDATPLVGDIDGRPINQKGRRQARQRTFDCF